MGRRRLNPNLVKIHRSYTVEMVAEVLGVHKNTVRTWIKQGLSVSDDRRPTLILGYVLREFLREKRQSRKRQCRLYELYCLRCHTPQRPAEDMADYLPVNATTGRLVGMCPRCSAMMNRFVNEAALERIRPHLDVSVPKAQRHISDRDEPLVNSDFN